MTCPRETLLEAFALKALPRAGWARAGVTQPESVAAHSWGVCYLVLTLCPNHLDRHRALAMAVVHDLAEVRTGDITPHDGIAAEEKARRENEAFTALVAALPRADELRALWRELEARDSPEARFVWACDKLDMALQAQRYRLDQHADTAEFIASALDALDAGELRDLAAGG